MKAYEYNENFKKWYGFDESGVGYVFLGNTYESKDIIKSMGAKWNVPIRAWVIDHKIDGYDLLPVTIDDVYCKGGYGKYEKYNNNVDGCERIANECSAYKENKVREEVKDKGIGFVGEVGAKIMLHLILDKCLTFYGGYGYYNDYSYKYIFHDINGNVFVWSTGKDINEDLDGDIDGNCIVTLKGKIKEHKEYKGVPQTILTRCEVLGLIKEEVI